jgi:hypothetical protein
MVCFHETKVEDIDSFFLLQCLGPNFDGFAFLPAEETRGGILRLRPLSVLVATSPSPAGGFIIALALAAPLPVSLHHGRHLRVPLNLKKIP